jgi:glutaredoxin
MSKITVFQDGSCYDCSFTPLVLPEGMDVEAIREEHNKWYREEYVGSLRRGRFGEYPSVPYVSFTSRLIAHGAREPTDDELEILED